MRTTRTSSGSTAPSRAAFFAELEKIAEAQQPQKPPLKERLKKWGKLALFGTAATGAGYLGGMAIERAAAHAFKDRWPQMDAATRHKFLYPALGVANLGLMTALAHAKKKRDELQGAHE